jgi:hypothetical protein
LFMSKSVDNIDNWGRGQAVALCAILGA